MLSAFAYYHATQQRGTVDGTGWQRLGRLSFLLHSIGVWVVIGTLFYILTQKMYEYQYAWANVSDDLPVEYVFSAFWKEQQGSFLLWSFWHIVLAGVLIWKSGKWEAPVMATIALAEAMIGCMLLGLHFGDFRFGASPFDLLRDFMEAPIFSQADYLSKVKGQGLNPLLQNYWMTIHPPTLFLGFASTIVPFAFAVAGLWMREHREWLRPALRWSLFSGAILGTGILMGGAWAYEALSFAGYWAWDPVENTSLVPWITLVAGIHTNLVARSTGYSIRSTYFFYLITFILILYSTYLTRSGILGDTSAHAFTEMGLGIQLVTFILLFLGLGMGLFLWRYRDVPDVVEAVKNKVNSGVGEDGHERAEMHTEIMVKSEESTTAREFWMFIGALILFFSATLITGATSLPVFNKIFGTDWALAAPVEHHNRYQLWIAVFIGMLTGIAQFLRYNERNWRGIYKKYLRHIGIATVGAALLTVLNLQWIDVVAWQVHVMLFAGMFAVVSNFDYLISAARGNLKMASSALSHIGFGVLVLGILSTGLGKEWITVNRFAMEGLIEGATDDQEGKNVILMKEAPLPIRRSLTATYLQDTIERQTRTFKVRFEKRDTAGNPTGESFVLQPNVMYDRQFSKVVASNPSTQHYWNYDIFTNVTSLPKAELDKEYAKQQEDSTQYTAVQGLVGDTIFLKKHGIIVDELTKSPQHPDYKAEQGDLALGAKLRVYDLKTGQIQGVEPLIYLRIGEGGFTLPANANRLQTRIRLAEGAMQQMFDAEDRLRYETHILRKGESFAYKGYQIQFEDVEKEIKHPIYKSMPGDIGVAARLNVLAPDGQTAQAAPVFLIRNSQTFSLKDEASKFGLHFKFDNIDPKLGTMRIGVAEMPVADRKVALEVAEDAPRSDYIVLEAIIFPGINLVWAGSILMLIGLAISFYKRLFLK